MYVDVGIINTSHPPDFTLALSITFSQYTHVNNNIWQARLKFLFEVFLHLYQMTIHFFHRLLQIALQW